MLKYNKDPSEIIQSDDVKTLQDNKEENEDPVAQAYLDHLLADGCNEGDSKNDMQMPEWYDEALFKRYTSYAFFIVVVVVL